MNETLFCIHVTGTDDLIPVRDMAEAVRASAFLNAEMLYAFEEITKNQDRKDLVPYCFAAPALWPYNAADHGKCLDEMITRSKSERCPHWLCT